MGMVKKSITVTQQHNDWVKAQVETGNFSNESEVFRDLLRDRISREAKIMAIRSALIEGERSGISNKSVDEIWQEAEQRHKQQNA